MTGVQTCALPIYISEAAFAEKTGFEFINSDFLNGLSYKESTQKVIAELEKIHHGKGKTNYRLRDAVFSRQRYWGEPFPVYYINGLPQMIDAKYLPIVLPEVEKYLPTEDGQPPLGNASTWAWSIVENKIVDNDKIDNQTVFPLELNTMPGWAGSSWYWMRYMDAHNDNEFASKEALDYWQNVDLYIGGSEHATGHLLYSRFWNKFLKDKGFAPTEEPFKKLINQGMILGIIEKALKSRHKSNQIWVNKKNILLFNDDEQLGEIIFGNDCKEIISENKDLSEIDPLPVPIEFVSDYNATDRPSYMDEEGILKFYKWQQFKNPVFISKDGFYKLKEGKFYTFDGNVKSVEDIQYFTESEVGKMSKSKYNVVNPDDICNEYGADTLRLYEMFLGPLEQAKPWNTAGITGVFGFLKKLWRLYFDDSGLIVTNNEPSKDSLKTLHKTIKKVNEDISNFSFNTSVSQFMICVNELSAQNCHERAILEPLAVLISPYAPHIAEELWSQLGHSGSISTVAFPQFDAKYLVESSKEYPVSFNGKMRFTLELPLDLTAAQIEEIVMKDERTIKQLEGKTPNKVIIVPGKIINLVG